MTDRKPSEPTPADFKEVGEKSVDAGVADEAAAYTIAIEEDEDDVPSGGPAALRSA